MAMARAILVLAGLALCTSAGAAAEAVPLVRNSAPCAAIAIPDAPHALRQYLAEELQAWLLKLTGARLTIYRSSALPENMPFISVVLVQRVSVFFMIALTRDIPSIYGRLQECLLEEHPGVPHA
jgi:hypothetical protein